MMQKHEHTKRLSTRRYLHRGLSFALASIFVLMAVVSATFAWSSISQRAVNPLAGENYDSEVHLRKYALDADGEPTEVRLAGALFALFLVTPEGEDSVQIPLVEVDGVWVIATGDDGQLTVATDADGRIVVRGLAYGSLGTVQVQAVREMLFS